MIQDDPKVRKTPALSPALRLQVLERDGWRCQLCGSMVHLQVHHIQFRSHSGADDEENLVTLCSRCHATRHGRPRTVR